MDDVDLEDNLNNIFKVLEKEYNLVPTLSESEEYIKKQAEYLNELLGDNKIVEKVQSFAQKNAYKDTDKKTYQAMEALIHNLNTMHSRAGARYLLVPLTMVLILL